jgi:hypothetical protein
MTTPPKVEVPGNFTTMRVQNVSGSKARWWRGKGSPSPQDREPLIDGVRFTADSIRSISVFWVAANFDALKRAVDNGTLRFLSAPDNLATFMDYVRSLREAGYTSTRMQAIELDRVLVAKNSAAAEAALSEQRERKAKADKDLAASIARDAASRALKGDSAFDMSVFNTSIPEVIVDAPDPVFAPSPDTGHNANVLDMFSDVPPSEAGETATNPIPSEPEAAVESEVAHYPVIPEVLPEVPSAEKASDEEKASSQLARKPQQEVRVVRSRTAKK